MTQSSLQTQCPNCQTRFRVTEEQLGIAKGKVRCGNCMKVFNAIEHQVIPGGGEKTRTSPAPEKPADTPSSADPGVSEEDFVFADNPEEDAAEGRYAGTKLTFSDDVTSATASAASTSATKRTTRTLTLTVPTRRSMKAGPKPFCRMTSQHQGNRLLRSPRNRPPSPNRKNQRPSRKPDRNPAQN